MNNITRALLIGTIAMLGIIPASALNRYETWIQGDKIKLCKGETALVIFASPDCQIKVTRPGCKAVTLKIEPTAKVVPEKRPRFGAVVQNVDQGVARITSSRNPIALVGPVTLTVENSSGPKLNTSYISAMITDTEF